jgi:hypothetical protein
MPEAGIAKTLLNIKMSVFIFLIVPVLCIGIIYSWMRNELSKLGRKFPMFNSSFIIYAEFMERASQNKKLKQKYNTVLISCVIISAFYIIFCLLIFT